MAFHFEAAGLSHVGMKRSQNQDRFYMSPELGLFVVADGMGGHKGGETASQMAVDVIAQTIASAASKLLGFERLHQAISAANAAIQQKGHSDASLQGMGTTVTALYFSDGKLFVGQVGDSRSYLVYPHRIWQITRDHSLVQEKLRAGLITRSQLKTDRMKNVITRSVGFEALVEIDIYELEPREGDVFVVCSDGLCGMVEDHQIAQLVTRDVFDKNQVELAAQNLIDAANRSGGDDNVTAIVVRIAKSG